MSDTPTTKVCTKCGAEKALGEYYAHPNTKDGLRHDCRACFSLKVRARVAKDPDTKREQDRRFYEREKVAILNKRRCDYLSDTAGNMLKSARRRANEIRVPFLITKDDIVVPDVCPVLGIKLKAGQGGPSASSPSLDRIIPELGYVPGNVRVVSHRANTMKSSGSPLEQHLIGQDGFRLLAARNQWLESELERLKKAQ